MSALRWPTKRDLENATYDGAVREITSVAICVLDDMGGLLNCASGSRYPRVHRFLARVIVKCALLIFAIRREPRNHPVGSGGDNRT